MRAGARARGAGAMADGRLRRARERGGRERAELLARAAGADADAARLRAQARELQADVAALQAALRRTQAQLDWWPRPLTRWVPRAGGRSPRASPDRSPLWSRLMGAVRCWLREPPSVSDAVLWALVPARHGC